MILSAAVHFLGRQQKEGAPAGERGGAPFLFYPSELLLRPNDFIHRRKFFRRQLKGRAPVGEEGGAPFLFYPSETFTNPDDVT